MRLKCFCTLYINIDSKWIKDIIVISETTELLEKKIGRKFSDINYSNILWICLLRKTKIKKWDLIKLKRFCTAKETANKTKGQTAAAAAAKSLQSCPTLCDPRYGSPPGSTVPGILQPRGLEWAAIAFSKGQTTEWEKVFSRDMTHEGLISKIYKQLLPLNIEKKWKKLD